MTDWKKAEDLRDAQYAAERFTAVLDLHATCAAKTHPSDPWKYDGTYVCACGDEFKAERGMGGALVAHRAHVAAALAAVADDGLAAWSDEWDVRPIIQERLAEAWDEGRAAERRDWEFTFDISTPDEDRQPWANPYAPAPSADRDERDGA